MKESLQYITDMEKKMSSLKAAHPDLEEKKPSTSTVQKREQRISRQSTKQNGGIENNLELGEGLKEHWYPVEFCSKLKADVLLPLELFGEKWVLFR